MWGASGVFEYRKEKIKEKLKENKEAVEVEVRGHSMLGKGEFLGRVVLTCEQVTSGTSGWMPLQEKKEKPAKKKKVRGEVFVEARFENPNIDEREMKELQELCSFQSEELQRMWQSFREDTKESGGQITSKKKLDEILCRENSSYGKSILDTLIRQWDLTGKNVVYETSNESFKTSVQKDNILREEMISMLWNALDTDADGKISFTELVIGLNVLTKGDKNQKARFQFKIMDVDRSGFLDKQEIQKINKFRTHGMRIVFELLLKDIESKLRSQGLLPDHIEKIKRELIDNVFSNPKLVDVGVDLCFKFADKDGNGQISEDEFVAFVIDENATREYVLEVEQLLQPALTQLKQEAQEEISKVVLKVLKN